MCSSGVKLAIALLPAGHGGWNFHGKFPKWVAEYPDWDCIRIGSLPDWDIPWNHWRRQLEGTSIGEWEHISTPYIDKIAVGIRRLDLEETPVLEIPCFLGVLTGVLMEYLICAQSEHCP